MDLADWMKDICFCSPFYLKLYYFSGCLVSLSFKACRLILSRSVDDLFDDSSDAVSPCNEVKNVMKDLVNVDAVSNAGAFVAEASVSAPEDVFKHNWLLKGTLISQGCHRGYAPYISVLLRI